MNPEIKDRRETIAELRKTLKTAFQETPPMPDPAMMQQGGMPMDPAMMQQGGMPMDPAMMQQGGMPMDPSMQGGMPMDPAMMQQGGMPMDPSMQGGAPPPPAGGELPPELMQIIEEMVGKFEQMAQVVDQIQQGNNDHEKRIARLEAENKMLTDALNSDPAPPQDPGMDPAMSGGMDYGQQM